MSVEALIASITSRGMRLFLEADGVAIEPASRLTDGDRAAIRANKAALIAHLRTGKRPVHNIVPNSRHPLVPDEVRQKIEAIEPEARAMNWPAELLWNAGFWDCPRGLAAVLEPEDEIGEVTADFIEVWKLRRHRHRFMRTIS
jgi:hypothetical protein